MTPEDALNHLTPIANCILEELKAVEQAHSCILAAHVATQVFHRLGYGSAHPLTVRARILNPPLIRWVKETKLLPNDSNADEWAKLGGQPIMLGAEPVPGRDWLGHVVVIVPNLVKGHNALLDLTIPQVNGRAAELELPPMFLAVTDQFVRGESPHAVDVNGGSVRYTAFPSDLGYKTSEIWAIRSQTNWFVDKIVARIKPSG